MKKYKNIFLIILLSIPPLVSIFRPGTYESGDLTFQAYKSLSFFHNLVEGHFIPRWSAELNATYGYPNFIFSYQFPYYLTSLVHSTGFDYIQSVKAALLLTYIASGIFFYLWIHNHLHSWAALVATILYQYAPYRFVTMHFRATLGESTAQMILPLSMLFLYRASQSRKVSNEWIAGITIAVLILSHQAVALLSLPLLGLYVLYLKKPIHFRGLWDAYRPLVIGILLSAYYWIPILGESRYTTKAVFQPPIQTYSLWEFLLSPYRFGLLFQGHHGELSPALGYVHLGLFCAGIWIFFKKRATFELKALLLILGVYFFLAQSFSPFWKLIPLLQTIQFTYRFNSVMILLLAAIGGYVTQQLKLKRGWIFIIIACAILITPMNWGNRKAIPYSKGDFEAYAPYITSHGEGLDPAAPRWVDPQNMWKMQIPKKHLVSFNGQLEILSEVRQSLSHTYIVQTDRPTNLIDNTYYFPGWKVLVNGVPTKISPDLPGYQALIAFQVPAGLHRIHITFQDTPLRTAAKWISIFTVLLGFISLYTYRHESNTHH